MAKGGSFEREIAKSLSLWWSNGERDDIFWRSQGSGARATVRAKKGMTTKGQSGDISATDPDGFPLIETVTIELKKGYNSWDIREILDKKKKHKTLEEFFQQCERERRESQVIGWWLITGQDRRLKLIFFDKRFNKFLIGKNTIVTRQDCIVIRSKKKTVYCMRYTDFLSFVNPNIFRS